jgi:hypothetical protein
MYRRAVAAKKDRELTIQETTIFDHADEPLGGPTPAGRRGVVAKPEGESCRE